MPVEKRVIKIESILGGHSPTSNFAASDQFRSSLGINPSLPVDDDYSPDGSGNSFGMLSSGLLRPVSVKNLGTTAVFSGDPTWFAENPKNANIQYVYDSNGSAYSITGLGTPTALSDGGTLASSLGNGIA